MAEFIPAVEFILNNEGGLSDHESDPGGVTNFGISLRFLKSVNPSATREDILALTRDAAIALYKEHFWDNQKYAEINIQNIANYIFDMSVNMGAAVAHKIAQRAVWAWFRMRVLPDDGVLGSKSLLSINAACNYLMAPMMSERASHYRLLVANNPKLECFLEGWLNRCYRG